MRLSPGQLARSRPGLCLGALALVCASSLLCALFHFAHADFDGPLTGADGFHRRHTLWLLWLLGGGSLFSASLSIYHSVRRASPLSIALAIVPWCIALLIGAGALVMAWVLVGWL